MTGAPAADLPGLVAARICHDLAGPLGAIGNALELAGRLGGPGAEDQALLAESAAAAAARLSLYRLAFAAASGGQMVRGAELGIRLVGALAGPRLALSHALPERLARAEARVIALAALCLLHALPKGGEIAVAAGGGVWRVQARGPVCALDEALRVALAGGCVAETARPATVEFALLPGALRAIGRAAGVEEAPGAMTLHLSRIPDGA